MFFGLILSSCNYLLIPRRYYDNYTKIINDKSRDTVSLDLNKVYVVEDTFLTRDYKTKSYNYVFLYKNNLIANFTTPFVYNSRIHQVSEKNLADSIKNGYFDKPNNKDRISWDYYEIKDGMLIRYFLDYDGSTGHHPLNRGVVKKSKFHIIKNGFIYLENLRTKTDSLLQYNFHAPKEFPIKPDSSKSDFILLYKKYVATGYRRSE